MKAYDPLTDTIIGCEPGTYAWYHEERHRQQYAVPGKLDKDARRVVMAFNLSLLLIPSMGLFLWLRIGGAWPWLPLGMMGGLAASYAGVWLNTIVLEIDAHLYAIRMWWRCR